MILVHRDADLGWLLEVRMGGCAEDAQHELADYADERTNLELREVLAHRMERFYWREGRLLEMLGKQPSEQDRVWVIAPPRDLRGELAEVREAQPGLADVCDLFESIIGETESLRDRIERKTDTIEAEGTTE